MRNYKLLFILLFALICFFDYNFASGMNTWIDLNGNFFEREDITVCDLDDDSECVTMMDRNLGATTNDVTSTGSYGYHYQWGNNYGFEIGCWTGNCADDVTQNATGVKVRWNSTYKNNGYFGNVFVKGSYDWISTNVYNWGWLWGGLYGDNIFDQNSNNFGYNVNTMGRQGPCPEGYHVPSRGEYGHLVKYWAEKNDIEYGTSYGFWDLTTTGQLLFQDYFKIPAAGVRFLDSARVGQLGVNGSMWLSSLMQGGDRNYVWHHWMRGGYGFDGNYIGLGFSVRCFKNEGIKIVNFFDGDELLEVKYVDKGTTISSSGVNANKANSYNTFVGWYKDPNFVELFDFETPVTKDLNLYAKYEEGNTWIDRNKNPFDWEDIKICDPNDDNVCITLMDRNLGASRSGTVCKEGDLGACGYLFQWGNNYGFENNGINGYEVNATIKTEQVNTSTYGPNRPYFSGIFYKGFVDWSSLNNDNLWGGGDDSEINNYGYGLENFIERSGPCPDGYHVPSAGEWLMLLKYWSDNYILAGNTLVYGSGFKDTDARVQFQNDLGIPFAGRVNHDNARLDAVTKNANLWFSANNSEACRLFLDSSNVSVDKYGCNRARAYSLRCFKNPVFTVILFDEDQTTQIWSGEVGFGTILSNSGTITAILSGYEGLKTGYNLNGWYISGIDTKYDLSNPITTGLHLVAKRTQSQISSNGQRSDGGGAGVGDKPKIDDCPNGDYSDSFYDGICGKKKISEDEQNISEDGEKDELQTAYERAYENGITTMDTVEKADLNGNLTRIAMAKMLSKYAINVLGKKPANIIVPKFNDVDEKLDSEYDNGVSLAYQLGIMGINMPKNNFRPFDLVSRAEFVTALSRMRYGTPDGEYAGTAEYYKNHMEILTNEGIVSLLDPEMLELRGYVMVMLMRSSR